MGEPATPTLEQFDAAHALAKEIVAAVTQDTATPIEVLGGHALASNICTHEKEAEIDHRLLVLAQLVIRRAEEIEQLRKDVEAAACPRCSQENDYCSECIVEIEKANREYEEGLRG